jgi:hypothetical protein
MSTPTSNGDAERDELVARALGTITVPDHKPGFWDRIDEALREQEPPGPELVVVPPVSVFDDGPDSDEPAPPVAEPVLHEVTLEELSPAEASPREPASRRWGRRTARALLAVAAVVAVAVAGVLVARRDDTGPDLSSQTVPTGSAPDGAGSSDGGAPPEGGNAPNLPTDLAPEQQVVVDFVDALGRGDIDAAAALLGPRSEEYLVSQSGSVESFLTEAAEGFGAWSASTDREVWTVEGLSVVVLEGTVSPEGMTEYRRQAFPVVYATSAKAWFVDPWAFDPAIEDQRIEFVEPAPALDGSLVITPGVDLQVAVAGPGTVSFSVDGDTPTVIPTTSGTSGDVASWRVPSEVADDATLVVIYQSESAATFTAIALPVTDS